MTITQAAPAASPPPLLGDVASILRHTGLTHGQRAARWRLADAVRQLRDTLRDSLDDEGLDADDYLAEAARDLLAALADLDEADTQATRKEPRR